MEPHEWNHVNVPVPSELWPATGRPDARKSLCCSTRPHFGSGLVYVCVSPTFNLKPIEIITQRFYHFTVQTGTMAFWVFMVNQELSVAASWLMEILHHSCGNFFPPKKKHWVDDAGCRKWQRSACDKEKEPWRLKRSLKCSDFKEWNLVSSVSLIMSCPHNRTAHCCLCSRCT